jgi:3-hydroxyisobutyrate dehydrogenase-like beta-hydroxyacid dehydrogenase
LIGLLHPGEMGAAVGAALTGRGHDVLWASEGRSAETDQRAHEAGLDDAGSVDELARRADVVFSICPPHAAADVARSVGGFEGLYVDANAVSPGTAQHVASMLGEGFVDGGIVGPPPREQGTTRLYLSGLRAAEVAELFAGSPLDARVLSERIGDASALKMVYAAWTKGTAALLLAIGEVARAEGVEAALLDEWALSQRDLQERSAQAAESARAKGWRWVGEMEEIAATFAAAGQPEGFHRAAAEVYRR